MGKSTDYEVVEEIGTGTFGTCCKIRRIADGELLVWKQISYSKMNEAEKESLVREVNLLRELSFNKHAYIVRYVDRIVNKAEMCLFLVTEFCAGGDLAQLIAARKEQRMRGKRDAYLDSSYVVKVFRQLLTALQALHGNAKNRILHRDLKPANVFLTAPAPGGDVKLGDFGLARVLHSDMSMAVSYVGTPFYMSPEQVEMKRYDEHSDVWSLGCLIYELCALHPPFTAKSQNELYSKIKRGTFRHIPVQYPDQLQRIIQKMLLLKPEMRPNVDQLLQSPLFTAKKEPTTTKLPKLAMRSGSPLRSKNQSVNQENNNHNRRQSSVNSSGYVSSTSASALSPKTPTPTPPPPRPINPAPITSTETTPSFDELKKWEESLKLKETDLQKREASVFEREKRADAREALLTKSPQERSTSPLVKLQNRLMPLMPRKSSSSKLKRSPSDPLRANHQHNQRPALLKYGGSSGNLNS